MTNRQRKRHALSFFDFVTVRMEELRLEERHSTADLCRVVRNRLLRFVGGKSLSLRAVTADLVEQFTASLCAEGLKGNTVRTYVSNFRALYNRACRKVGLPLGKASPFTFQSLKRAESVPRALDGETFREVVSFVSTDKQIACAVDYCMFSYLACGMPFADMARLTVDNLCGDEIVYRRRKTGTLIRIGITPAIRLLLNKYADISSPYLFPILPKGGKIGHEGYKSLLRSYNEILKTIGRKLSRPVKLTSYVMRHTWATNALRKHIPLSVISRLLGHTSESTTRFYLASLDQADLNRANIIVTGDIEEWLMRKERSR